MDDGGFEQRLGELLSQDLSAGTEAFRESLLGRCLGALGGGGARGLSDDELEMLSAAGDVASLADASGLDRREV
jgi:hypothetical protein